MADLTIRLVRRGLSADERAEMTFQAFRLQRLVALEDGVEKKRPEAGKRTPEGQQAYTNSPTVAHLAVAIGIAASSLRTYEAGTASPRWEIGEMCDFAEALGLTVEELNYLIVNSATAGAAERKRKAEEEAKKKNG